MLDRTIGTKKPAPADQHIGARIRMRRSILNMSQEKLGELLGVTFQQVQKYEKGTNRVGGSRLAKAAEVLGVSPGFFFEGLEVDSTTGEAAELSETAQFLTTREGVRLTRAFVTISDPTVRQKVLGLVEALSGQSGTEH